MPRRLAAVVAAVAIALAGCGSGGGGGERARCAPEVHERLDPNSIQHLLPGADPPTYQTHPPTSGAHQVGAWPTGVLDDPVREPVQVALLEGGEIVIQYRRALPSDEQRELERFARRTDRVTVAPAGRLPAAVVATAWTYKQTCGGVDLDALGRFVRAHAGKGA